MTLRVDKIVSWNVHVSQDAADVRRQLRDLLADEDPEMAAVQEVSGDVPTLRGLKAVGYRVLIGRRAKGVLAGQESQSTALLAKHGVGVAAWTTFRMLRTWRGPKRGLRRPGRTFVTAVVGSPKIRVTAVHGVTGKNTAANRPAWRETMATLTRKAKVWRRRAVWIGDWNDPHGDFSVDSVRAFARRVGGTVVHDESRLDYAVVRGFRSARLVSKTRRGSDHRVVVLHLDY